jgi:hypothetical protein
VFLIQCDVIFSHERWSFSSNNKVLKTVNQQVQRRKAASDDGHDVGGRTMAPPPFQLKSGSEKPPIQMTKSEGTSMPSIVLKRKHIHLTGDDKYGHWWVELDGNKSYGWWPKDTVGPWATLTGTEGELNGQTNFGGQEDKDPYHLKSAEQVLGVECTDPSLTEPEVKQNIIKFAKEYSGEWRWTFGFGQNCHTFQESMLNSTRLKVKK